MPQRIRIPLLALALLLGLGLLAPSLHAQSTGTIAGRVYDAQDGSTLPGANVVVEGTSRGTSTNLTGRYRLTGLPAGTHTLVVTFIGYERAERQVTVEAGATIIEDFALESETLRTGEVVVTGLREGQLRSISQKRQAPNVIDVLSADAIGKLPDQNVAEAVRRIPGVAIQLDNGEGRFVSIRGAEPALNNVTVNGQSLASSAESRATALDLVPASMVSSIEVIKAVTPDMDANAVGGTVNINTLTAFDRTGPFVSATGSILQQQQVVDYRTEQLPFRGTLTAGTQFGAQDQFGLVVSGNFSRRDYKASTVGATEFLEDDAGFIRPEALETEVEDTRRDRYALNANFDFRPTEATNLFARTFYSRTDEFDDNAEFQFEFAEVSGSSATGTILEAEGALDLELTQEDESLFGLTLGGEHSFGAVTVMGDATYTRGLFDRATDKPEFVAEFEGDDLGSYDNSGDFLSVDYADFGAVSNPTNYIYDEIDLEFESNTEDTYVVGGDVRWDTQFGGYQGFLKVGGKFRTREKIIDDLEEGFNGGDNPFTLALDPVDAPTGLQGGARYPVMGDTEDLFDRFEEEEAAARAGTSERFEADDAETLAEGIENDSNNDEDVYAGYVMGSVQIGRLQALGGVRIEATETRSERFVALFDADDTVESDEIGSEVFTNDYVNVLPSLHLTYTATDNLLVRAALSNTIGRPDYEELSGFQEIEIEQTETETEASVNEGNPNLEPFKSLNLDLTAEYYTSTGGLFAIGGFYKRIRDAIFEFETTQTNTTLETEVGTFEVDQLNFTQDRNADVGTILGVEATAQQAFVFLPSPFDGLGLSSNLTLTNSEVDIPGREDGEVPFFGQSDVIATVIPYYQKAGFELRAAFSYQSEFLTSAGGAAFEDEYFDERLTLDLTASYAIIPERLEVRAQARNVTNETEQFYQGFESRRIGNIETGRTFSLGFIANY